MYQPGQCERVVGEIYQPGQCERVVGEIYQPGQCEGVVGDVSGRVDPHDSPERHQVPPQDGLVVFLTVVLPDGLCHPRETHLIIDVTLERNQLIKNATNHDTMNTHLLRTGGKKRKGLGGWEYSCCNSPLLS